MKTCYSAPPSASEHTDRRTDPPGFSLCNEDSRETDDWRYALCERAWLQSQAHHVEFTIKRRLSVCVKPVQRVLFQ